MCDESNLQIKKITQFSLGLQHETQLHVTFSHQMNLQMFALVIVPYVYDDH